MTCCGCCCECGYEEASAAQWEWDRQRRQLQRAVERDGSLTFAEWNAKIDADYEQWGEGWLARAARVWARDADVRLAPPPMVLEPREAGRGRLGGYTTAAAAAEKALAEHRSAVVAQRLRDAAASPDVAG